MPSCRRSTSRSRTISIILHFGAGQTEAKITLPLGPHKLRLLFADDAHVPHDPPVYSERHQRDRDATGRPPPPPRVSPRHHLLPSPLSIADAREAGTTEPVEAEPIETPKDRPSFRLDGVGELLQNERKGLLFALRRPVRPVAQADRRVALVIGNSAYRNASTLPNTINDANAIATLFRSVGFEVVISRNDLGVLDFKRAVRDFLITAETADIAVVYYAGHGIEVDGANYLIPVDAKLARDYDVEDEAVALDRIIWALQPVKRLRLILLDACRDNPVRRAAAALGLDPRRRRRAGSPRSTMSAPTPWSPMPPRPARSPMTATARTAPFATALLKHLAEPGLDIRIALGRVRDEVLQHAPRGRQEPFIYGSLGGATIPLVPLSAAEKARTRAGAAGGRRQAGAGPRDPAEPGGCTGKTQSGRQPRDPLAARRSPAERCGRAGETPVAARTPPAAASRRENRAAKPAQRTGRGRGRSGRGLQSRRTASGAAAFRPGAGRDCQVPARTLLRPAARRRCSACSKASPPAPSGRAADGDAKAAARQQAQAQPVPAEDACARDASRLASLRADPSIDAITKFERELGCEQIRPQLQRLRESLGG